MLAPMLTLSADGRDGGRRRRGRLSLDCRRRTSRRGFTCTGGGVQQGGYDLEAHTIAPSTARRGLRRASRPCRLLFRRAPRPDPPEAPRYLLNGVPIAAEEARDARREGPRRRPEQAPRHRHRAGRRAQEGPARDRVASGVRLALRFDVDPRLSAGPLVARRRLRDHGPADRLLSSTVGTSAASPGRLRRRRRCGGDGPAPRQESYDPRHDPDLRTWLSRRIMPFADAVERPPIACSPRRGSALRWPLRVLDHRAARKQGGVEQESCDSSRRHPTASGSDVETLPLSGDFRCRPSTGCMCWPWRPRLRHRPLHSDLFAAVDLDVRPRPRNSTPTAATGRLDHRQSSVRRPAEGARGQAVGPDRRRTGPTTRPCSPFASSSLPKCRRAAIPATTPTPATK